ncbi:MAG: phosphonate C-P lyase system protein PhnH [Paracoccaceae bacterium]|nr:phosphonate C-P lyase system protein PhnH [Paracoccaceae bacterium]
MSDVPALEGGFADPAREAAAAFRGLLGAMARPGRIEPCGGAVPPAPMSIAAGSALLVLCDPDTPLHLAGPFDTAELGDWVAFHTGAPLASASECRFAVGPWEALQPLDRFAMGTPEYPDRSATLIVEMADLAAHGARLTGPGIETEAFLSLPEIAAFETNRRAFPRGLDFILTKGCHVAALPRTTKVE